MNVRVRIRRIATEKEIAKAFAIRMRVFVREQGVPEEIELDADEPRAIHFLAFVGARAVGTARVVRHGGSAKIGRMAVLKSYRGRGIGKKLLRRAIDGVRRTEVRDQRSASRDQRSDIRGRRSAFRQKNSKAGIQKPAQRRAIKIYLHAQVPAIGFYESMGFRCVGPIFQEAGIAHRKMILPRRTLPPSAG